MFGHLHHPNRTPFLAGSRFRWETVREGGFFLLSSTVESTGFRSGEVLIQLISEILHVGLSGQGTK